MGNYLDKIKHLHAERPDESSLPQTPATVVIELAARNARAIYWERANGSIVGPARPEFMAKVGDGSKGSYWVVVQFEGQPVWVNSAVLRSCREFERQVKSKPFERIKEPR